MGLFEQIQQTATPLRLRLPVHSPATHGRRHRLRVFLVAGVFLAAVACSSSETPDSADAPAVSTELDDTVEAGSSAAEPDPPVTEPIERPTPVAIGDLTDAPFITFAPIGPRPQPDSEFPDGSADYWDLFVEGADWQQALQQVDAVKIHSWQARAHFGDRQIIDLVDFLAAQEIPLIVEMEPLQPPDPDECNHTESFEGPLELRTAGKIKRNGGVIAAVAIEQPYTFGHKMEGEGACQYSVERITDELVTWVADLREIFPDVVIGSIEGIWTAPATTPEDMAVWLDAYEAALGEPLAFLHMDVNWSRGDWADVALGIEAVAEARGVPFGLLINGGIEQRNDEWLQFAAERMADFEAAGGTPAHVTFQSWVDQPDRALPETDIGAFTHLINRYLGTRSPIESVAIDPPGDGDGDGLITGRLADREGTPLPGLVVEAAIRTDPDALQTIRLDGRPPTDADSALIVIRSNAEDAGAGRLDARLRNISFTQADGINLVLNGDFTAGDSGWGGDPGTRGFVQFEAADGGSLQLAAEVGQPIFLNSESFPVDGGEGFEFSIAAFIADLDGAVSSGQVAVAFLDGDREVGRNIVEIVTQFDTLEAAVTDADGRFTIDTGRSDTSAHEIVVSTPGDLLTWPASVTLGPTGNAS